MTETEEIIIRNPLQITFQIINEPFSLIGQAQFTFSNLTAATFDAINRLPDTGFNP